MKKIYLSLLLIFCLSFAVYSTYAQPGLEGRQLSAMCEKIHAFEEECGAASPGECSAGDKAIVNDFLNVCFFNNTANSLACIKRINWLYADMFANNQIEPCRTSLSSAAR